MYRVTGANPEKGGLALRDYELVIIFQPGDGPDLPAERVERIASLVAENEGEVSGVYHWGRRKFAYPIKKLQDGFYVLFKLKLATEKVRPLETSVKLERDILRHLLVLDEGGEGPVARTAPAEG